MTDTDRHRNCRVPACPVEASREDGRQAVIATSRGECPARPVGSRRHRLLRTAAAASLALTLLSCSPGLADYPELHVAAKAAQVPKGKVVLVHGIFDTRITMRPLRKAIVAGGYGCLVPSLKPVDGRDGLDLLAGQLRDVIDQEFAKDERFSIVAFSMGGLVSRYYLQELGGADRCDGLYTLATPHNGTYIAYLYPGRGTQQMRPESRFLLDLKKSESVLADIPLVSYRNPLDVAMLPSKSPEWKPAANVRVPSAIHPSLMWEKRLQADLLKRLEKNRKQ